jgi:hypothetical protein
VVKYVVIFPAGRLAVTVQFPALLWVLIVKVVLCQECTIFVPLKDHLVHTVFQELTKKVVATDFGESVVSLEHVTLMNIYTRFTATDRMQVVHLVQQVKYRKRRYKK